MTPTATAPDSALSLTAYEWYLTSATDKAGQPLAALQTGLQQPLKLLFNQDGMSIQGGCNTQFGGYRHQGGLLQVANLASTMKACEPALMKLDAEMGRLMKGDMQARLEGQGSDPRLVLVAQDGSVLTFTGEPTPETRYGSPAERIFLEVAPERVACNDPLIRNRQCLQVRERKYSEAGVLLPAQGPWEPLYASIQGYTHQDGARAVLRVNRYDWKNPPADASSKVYVLDMVVEQHAPGR